MGNEQRLARALGWASIGLGVPQLIAPTRFAQWVGASGDSDSSNMVFLVGVREISCGIGALTRRRPVGWLLARVAGDAMDLALLNSARNSRGTQKNRLMAAMAAVIGIAMLDLRASLQLSRQRDTDSDTQGQGGILDVKKSITVNRSAEEVYGFWRDFQNLPRFMSHLEEVQVTGDRRSHWKAKAPAGKTVEWDAEITDDQPNRLIAWRSVGKADVDNSGSVRFVPAPGERGTEIHVEMHYNPPAGRLGAVVAKLFGEGPDWQVADDLRAFKQVMEVGEVVHSDASIHRRPHAAQPPKEMPTNLQERAAGQ